MLANVLHAQHIFDIFLKAVAKKKNPSLLTSLL